MTGVPQGQASMSLAKAAPFLDRNSDLSDYEQMFELAPVSLWLEDFSGVRALFEDWRAAGIGSIRRVTTSRVV